MFNYKKWQGNFYLGDLTRGYSEHTITQISIGCHVTRLDVLLCWAGLIDTDTIIKIARFVGVPDCDIQETLGYTFPTLNEIIVRWSKKRQYRRKQRILRKKLGLSINHIAKECDTNIINVFCYEHALWWPQKWGIIRFCTYCSLLSEIDYNNATNEDVDKIENFIVETLY